jgi:hypothetical protein
MILLRGSHSSYLHPDLALPPSRTPEINRFANSSTHMPFHRIDGQRGPRRIWAPAHRASKKLIIELHQTSKTKTSIAVPPGTGKALQICLVSSRIDRFLPVYTP